MYKVKWFQESGIEYENGYFPTVAINKFGYVVETHQAGTGESAQGLYYRVGKIADDNTITWLNTSQKFTSGIYPQIALADVSFAPSGYKPVVASINIRLDGVATHLGVRQRSGELDPSSGKIEWSDPWYLVEKDDVTTPSLSLSRDALVIVATYQLGSASYYWAAGKPTIEFSSGNEKNSWISMDINKNFVLLTESDASVNPSLYYRLVKADGNILKAPRNRYTDGENPQGAALTLADGITTVFLEVHEDWGTMRLYNGVGVANWETGVLDFSNNTFFRYDSGEHPALAAVLYTPTPNATIPYVVEVHETNSGGSLWYRTGTVIQQ